MSLKLLIFLFFFHMLLRNGHSFYYFSCSTYSCSSGCCKYTYITYNTDFYCSYNTCQCAYMSDCLSESYTLSGYHNCSTTRCSGGCCYYSATLTYDDYYCNSLFCECGSSSYCGSTSSSFTSKGHHYCSFNNCVSVCCYYSSDLYSSDYHCNTLTCSCSSSSNCGVSTSNTYTDSDYLAKSLSNESGTTYVVVNYTVWKAMVVVGSIICGILLCLNTSLIYYKCFHKPKNFTNFNQNPIIATDIQNQIIATDIQNQIIANEIQNPIQVTGNQN